MEFEAVVSLLVLITMAIPYVLVMRILWYLGSYLKDKWMDSVKPKNLR